MSIIAPNVLQIPNKRNVPPVKYLLTPQNSKAGAQLIDTGKIKILVISFAPNLMRLWQKMTAVMNINKQGGVVKLLQKHIVAVRELIKRYRTITLKEINGHVLDGDQDDDCFDLGALTGFGHFDLCTLCQTTASKAYRKAQLQFVPDCSKCIYREYIARGSAPCTAPGNGETYYAIKYAKTAEGLLSAFRARADHLENILKRYEEELCPTK